MLNNPEKFRNRNEYSPEVVVSDPVIETFLDPSKAVDIWPEAIESRADFLDQVENRKKLYDQLDNLFNSLPSPDIGIDKALIESRVSQGQVIETLNSLSDFLESDPDYYRIVLYLPFELFFDNKKFSADEELSIAVDRFAAAYMTAWKGLLSMHDVRANFVDGDVMEEEHRRQELPRVVKAAHLIPKLVEKGLMDTIDAIDLMENCQDELLTNSIADTFSILADMQLLSEADLKRMENSSSRLVKNTAKIIIAGLKREEAAEAEDEIDLESLPKLLNEKFSQIENDNFEEITSKRKKWLIQKRKSEVIDNYAQRLANKILADKISYEQVSELLAAENDLSTLQLLIDAVRVAMEKSNSDERKSRDIYEKSQEVLVSLWQRNNSELNKILAKFFRRLNNLKIIDDNFISNLNIDIPNLTGQFSKNLNSMAAETASVKNNIEAIEADPELSKLIFPIVLLYGSKLKGYGMKEADIDLAVFVRPETSGDNLMKIKNALGDIFGDEVVQFWLEEKENKLSVRELDDNCAGKSHWVHVLFGAAWEGSQTEISKLQEKLLPKYLTDDNMIGNMKARQLYLEELERDSLQYRLMHNGYERFFPSSGGINTEHQSDIDGASIFWDSGYRQLATKLYLSRVFLPKI